jgi:hypothetical protein
MITHRNKNKSCINEWQIVDCIVYSKWNMMEKTNMGKCHRICHGTRLEEVTGMWFCKCWNRSIVGDLMLRCFGIHCPMFCISGVVGHISLYCRQVHQWNRCVVMARQIRGTKTVPCLGWDICAWAVLLLVCISFWSGHFVQLVDRIHLCMSSVAFDVHLILVRPFLFILFS